MACRGNIALCKLNMGDWDGVVDNCEKILENDNTNVKALFRMAQALDKQDPEGNQKKAKQLAEKAKGLSPQDSEIIKFLEKFKSGEELPKAEEEIKEQEPSKKKKNFMDSVKLEKEEEKEKPQK